MSSLIIIIDTKRTTSQTSLPVSFTEVLVSFNRCALVRYLQRLILASERTMSPTGLLVLQFQGICWGKFIEMFPWDGFNLDDLEKWLCEWVIDKNLWMLFFISAAVQASVNLPGTNVDRCGISQRNWRCSNERRWSFYSNQISWQLWYDLCYLLNKKTHDKSAAIVALTQY